MVISLRCKECKDRLIGKIDEYLFLCRNCQNLFILREDKFLKIDAFVFNNEIEAHILLPFLIFKVTIDYLDFATEKQKEVSIRCGNKPTIAVRAFSMIDPIYFGDLSLEITAKLNKSNCELLPYKPKKKNFTMNIKPETLQRLSRYTFMKYFDRQTDITGMKYTFQIESFDILFLIGNINSDKLKIIDFNKEVPLSTFFIDSSAL